MLSCVVHHSLFPLSPPPSSSFFFFNDSATTEIYTLSLHDALPISRRARPSGRVSRLKRATPANAMSARRDRKSTRLNSSHTVISYAVFCLKKKKKTTKNKNIKQRNKRHKKIKNCEQRDCRIDRRH